MAIAREMFERGNDMVDKNKNLNFAQGTLGVRIKREEQQPLNLVEIFSSRGVDLTTGADF